MPFKTQAAVLFDTGKPLRVIELEIPSLKPGQVLIEVAFSGVCHSQLNEVRGYKGPDRFLPHTLGHEGAGTVVATGGKVTKVKPGDRVVLSWLKGSGADVPGTVYRKAPRGRLTPGAISTFMRRTVTCESGYGQFRNRCRSSWLRCSDARFLRGPASCLIRRAWSKAKVLPCLASVASG